VTFVPADLVQPTLVACAVARWDEGNEGAAMSAEPVGARVPTGARQVIEIADRLGSDFGGRLGRTAIYRCVCISQESLIAAGKVPTADLVELVARTAIEQRLGRHHTNSAEGQPGLLHAAS
jgi:hypothetical protein